MDVYKGHGEGDTKWKGCAWKLLLFKFNMIFYNKFIIRLFFFENHNQNIPHSSSRLTSNTSYFVYLPYLRVKTYKFMRVKYVY